MELVIKITKKLYDRYKKTDHIKICELDEFEKALDKCIILPKGHGRLIDVNDLLDDINLEDNDYNRDVNVGEIITLENIDRIRTIIEADKAESEE